MWNRLLQPHLSLWAALLLLSVLGCSKISEQQHQNTGDPDAKQSSPQPTASAKTNTASVHQVKQIGAAELHKLLTTGESPLIIDVSTLGQFKEGHIAGSLHGDESTLRARPKAYLDSLGAKTSDSIYLVCETGNKSYRIAEILMRAGYENVYNLESGKLNWARSGYDLIKGEQ
jgi:rhodanese-related sulfurtransferase